LDLRELQRPIKERYRADPDEARITISARGSQADLPTACSIDIGRAVVAAQAHAGVGGTGVAPCSGDLMLAALAACAQITCQMVATTMGIALDKLEVTAEGELDLRGTLGLSPDAPVGFAAIRLGFEIEAAGVPTERMAVLRERTERYCVVMQTLAHPPVVESIWPAGDPAIE
jgi:uncharacterized OsmC-like protein